MEGMFFPELAYFAYEEHLELLPFADYLSIISSCSLNGRQLIDGSWPTPTQLMSLIRLHLLEGIFSIWRKDDSLSTFLSEDSFEWMDEILWDIFLGWVSVWFFAKSLASNFICFKIFIILTSLINLTVLVPSLAAREALEICEILAALFPPPVMYCVIQIRSKTIVMVDMISSQK